MADLAPSVRATYDSQVTGPRYWITVTVNDHPIEFQAPMPDPFVCNTVRVSWADVFRALLRRRRVTVVMTVGADRELMNDVLELDDQALVAGRTRQAAFRQSMHGKLAAFGEEVGG